jgi:membrane associated rhomboid family serine protease
MSIYDREYVRVGPRSSSGLGSLGLISVNSWIIIANVAVFVLNLMVAGPVRPVPVHDWVPAKLGQGVPVDPVTPDVRLSSRVLSDALGRQAVVDFDPGGVLRVRDNLGRLGPSITPPPDSVLTEHAIEYRRGEPYRQVQRSFQFMPPLERLGYFSTAYGFFGVEMWRFITFQFLHANITHLLFNMFGLWVFGGMVEQYLGSKRYFAFYLTCGIFGAVSYLALNFLGNVLHVSLPFVLNDSIFTPLIGASAGVFGVIMACAYIAPNAMVMLLFPPIPLKLKWLAYGYVLLAAWNLWRQGNNAGGDAAHLGGAIAGAFFIRRAHLLRDFFDIFGPRKGKGRWRRDADVHREDLDRILAKVARDGLKSLSEAEKRTLRIASERMRR